MGATSFDSSSAGASLLHFIIVIAIASGTRPVDLVRGLFLDPARFSNGFTIPLGIPVGVVAWGAICLGGAALYHRYGLRLSWRPIETMGTYGRRVADSLLCSPRGPTGRSEQLCRGLAAPLLCRGAPPVGTADFRAHRTDRPGAGPAPRSRASWRTPWQVHRSGGRRSS